MVAFTRSVVGLSALLVAGAVGMGSLTDARPQPTPASVIADRFVFTAELQAPAGEGVDLTAARRDAAAALAAIKPPVDTLTRKGNRLDVEAKASCGDRAGSSADCPATIEGAPAPVRSITFQHRTGPSTSEATRILVANVASR